MQWEVKGLGLSASRGGPPGTTPENVLDCGTDVALEPPREQTVALEQADLTQEHSTENERMDLAAVGAAGRGEGRSAAASVAGDRGGWSTRSRTPDTTPESGVGCGGVSGSWSKTLWLWALVATENVKLD